MLLDFLEHIVNIHYVSCLGCWNETMSASSKFLNWKFFYYKSKLEVF